MDAIRQIGMLLCTLSLLSLLVFWLLPKIELSETVKAYAGVFCTAAIAFAVWHTGVDVRDSFGLDFSALHRMREQNTQRMGMEKTLSLAEHAVEDGIYNELKEEGFSVERIRVRLHITDGGSIEISSITLAADEENWLAIAARVWERYGVKPTRERQ